LAIYFEHSKIVILDSCPPLAGEFRISYFCDPSLRNGKDFSSLTVNGRGLLYKLFQEKKFRLGPVVTAGGCRKNFTTHLSAAAISAAFWMPE